MLKREILSKPMWSLADVKNYFGIGSTTASKMMQAAKRIKVSKYSPSKAYRDVLLDINGLNFEDEVMKAKILEG